MKTELIHNTAAQLPDVSVSPGDVIEAVQLCPFGDFPQGGVVQHCTADAFAGLVKDWEKNGAKEILVDFEHHSEDETGDTSAAAWATNLRVDEKRGLVADFRLTDIGAEA